MSTFLVVGMNHRSADIALRERCLISADRLPDALRRALAELPVREAVLVSTCNRTEVYAVVDQAAGLTSEQVCRFLVHAAPDQDVSDIVQGVYRFAGRAAVGHLLSVCASLDSMVVGEVEILGQVKQAYQSALDAGLTGKTINTLFQHAFKIAKRVQSETRITQGRVSVSSIAVGFACNVFSDLLAKTVMIIGAGETAELTLRSLFEQGANDVLILNRSLENAERIANAYGGKASPLEFLPELLPKADIVISSSGAPHCLITKDLMARVMKERQHKPMLLVDIAMPRDIAPDVADLRDVYLYHIDDLKKVADANLEKRQGSVDEARRIVDQGIEEIASTVETPDLDAILRDFEINARAIAETALAKCLKKERMSALPQECRDEVEALVFSVTKKLLAQPRTAMRQASKNGHWADYARVVRDLFGVQKEGQSRDKTD